MKLTKFEANLYRFASLEGSFHQLFLEFPKIEEGKTFYSFKSLIRELAVIKLHSFLKARELFLEDLSSADKKMVDASLSPLWEPIFKQKEAIRLLRNKYLAHMQEEGKKSFDLTREEILYNTKAKTSWNDITYYCGCALNYCKFIRANFQKEYESARGKYHASIPLLAMIPRFDIKHVVDPESELLESIKNSVNNLKENKLIFEIPPPADWSVSYKKNDSNVTISFTTSDDDSKK